MVSIASFIANTLATSVPFGFAITRLHQTFVPRHIFIRRYTVKTAGSTGAPVAVALFHSAAALSVHACAPTIILSGPCSSSVRSTGATPLAFIPRLVVFDLLKGLLHAEFISFDGRGRSAQLVLLVWNRATQRAERPRSNNERQIVPHRHTHLRGEDAGNRTEQDEGGRGQDEELHCWLCGRSKLCFL
jgi:hypothetical protein